MGTFKKFRKKSLTKPKKSLTKPKSLIVPKKVRTFCLGILVKKLAHTHGFEHETSGLKSKHLTTRPRTRETCELPREIRELSRGKKKHPHFPITLAYRKCKNIGCPLLVFSLGFFFGTMFLRYFAIQWISKNPKGSSPPFYIFRHCDTVQKSH